MKLQPPRCDICKNPMQPVQTLDVKKGEDRKRVTVYTCYEHKTFKKVEEKV